MLFIHKQITLQPSAWSTSVLQYPSVILADGMIFRPGVFSYGRFVGEALEFFEELALKSAPSRPKL